MKNPPNRLKSTSMAKTVITIMNKDLMILLPTEERRNSKRL